MIAFMRMKSFLNNIQTKTNKRVFNRTYKILIKGKMMFNI